MAELKIAVNSKYVKEIETDYEKLSLRSIEFNPKKVSKEAQGIIVEMKNTMRANDLLGLSAPQIGYYARIICLNFNGEIRTFINPIITKFEGFELSRETCHSIKNKTFIRPRNNKIDIMYQTPLGKTESATLVGFAARLFQHHIDHLEGILLSDIGLEIDEAFDNATQEEREQIIDIYLDSLDIKKKEISTEIENDKDAKEFSDAIKFLQSVENGETIIEAEEITKEEYERLCGKIDDTKRIMGVFK